VIRRCTEPCEPGCNCDLIPIPLDIDELLPEELAAFTIRGTPAQRAEIADWLDPMA
jgi:hypothetical protein